MTHPRRRRRTHTHSLSLSLSLSLSRCKSTPTCNLVPISPRILLPRSFFKTTPTSQKPCRCTACCANRPDHLLTMIIDGEKFACEACVRGHRVSNCQHSGKLRRPTAIATSHHRPSLYSAESQVKAVAKAATCRLWLSISFPPDLGCCYTKQLA